MIQNLLQGLLLGLAYVAPIGAQNINVINTAIQKPLPIAIRTSLITIFFDISLALSCFLGLGYLFSQFVFLKLAVLLIGGLLVILIGIKLTFSKVEKIKKTGSIDSFGKAITTSFIVTWLNPQAIIDGSMLLGGTRATLPAQEGLYFLLGVCIASFIWFTLLAVIVSAFKKTFNQKILRTINIICGIVIIFFGLRLIYAFIISVL